MIRRPDPGLCLDSGRVIGVRQYFAMTHRAGGPQGYRQATRSSKSVGNSAWSRSRPVGRSASTQAGENRGISMGKREIREAAPAMGRVGDSAWLDLLPAVVGRRQLGVGWPGAMVWSGKIASDHAD